MAPSNIKFTNLRGPNNITQDGAGKRMVSADGTRWAISRNYKRSLPGRRYDSVEAWQLKERKDGKVVTVDTAVTEEYARQWIAGQTVA